MKETILLIILTVLLIGINGTNKRIDRLIEISTPEYVNVLPKDVIKE